MNTTKTARLVAIITGALLIIGDFHAVMARGESSFVAIEIAGRATVSVDVVKGRSIRGPQLDTGSEYVCVELGDPVQDSVQMAYESLFAVLTDEHGYTKDDAYALMSAVAHTELGGHPGHPAPRRTTPRSPGP